MSSRKILLAFGALLALIVFFSFVTWREAHVLTGGEHLARWLIIAGLARTTVVTAVVIALLRSRTARLRAEGELKRSRDEALAAAEGRRVAQLEAERLGESLRAVLDRIDMGVILFERDGKISLFNRAAERIHGAWREQMERVFRAGEHKPARAEDGRELAPEEEPLARALKGETIRGESLVYWTPFRPAGYRVSVDAVPLHDHRGMPAGAVLVFSEAPGGAEPPSAK
jgi:PAS domain-containing protein